MNQQSTIALKRLKNYNFSNTDVILVMAFGSQVRGDHHANSDLDILHIDDKHTTLTMNQLCNIMGNAMNYTILHYKKSGILDWGRLYGRPEYRALREGMIIYKKEPQASVLLKKINVEYTQKQAVRRYLKFAKSDMQDVTDYFAKDANWACCILHRAMDSSIKALLLQQGVKFPFMRSSVRAYCDLLPIGVKKQIISLLPTEKRLKKWNQALRGKQLNQNEYKHAKNISKNIYDAVVNFQ